MGKIITINNEAITESALKKQGVIENYKKIGYNSTHEALEFIFQNIYDMNSYLIVMVRDIDRLNKVNIDKFEY